MNSRLWLALPVALTLAPCSPSLLSAHADAPLQQAGVEADSDGDGIPDSKDRYPLIADFELLTWRISKLSFDWSVKSETRVLEQTSVTWSAGDSATSVTGNKSLETKFREIEGGGRGGGGINANPLRLFGLLDMSVSVEARGKAGFTSSQEMEWSARRQQQSTSTAESFLRTSTETVVSDPVLSVWITFCNHSAQDLSLRPSGLPVFVDGQPVVSAEVTERVGLDGSLLLPANRPDGVPVHFKAPLNSTTARQLLTGLGAGAPSIDLARSRSVIRRVDGTGDAISAAKRIEDRTVEISVASGDIRAGWRVAASDVPGRRAVTIGAALAAITDRLTHEFGNERGPLFAFEKSRLTSIAATPARSDDGAWFVSIAGRDVGALKDWSLDQPLKPGQAIAFEFKSKAELQEERYRKAKAQVDSGDQRQLSSAVVVLRELAEQGYAPAQRTYGYCLDFGKGVSIDRVKGLEWYRKAAEQGDVEAQYSLGLRYARIVKDDTKASEWFRKAAEQGDALAQVVLGARYARGTGVPKDEAKAVEWYRKAAEQGLAEAQSSLGDMYSDGRGVPKDDTKAVDLYRKAAEQGYAMAQFSLGAMYFKGEGVARDVSSAAEWWHKAAEQGDLGLAQGMLGFLYGEGLGVERDDVRAYFWYSLAAARPGPSSADKLAALRLRMTSTQIAAAEKMVREFKPKTQPTE
jgi:TPR repeat protein